MLSIGLTLCGVVCLCVGVTRLLILSGDHQPPAVQAGAGRAGSWAAGKLNKLLT